MSIIDDVPIVLGDVNLTSLLVVPDKTMDEPLVPAEPELPEVPDDPEDPDSPEDPELPEVPLDPDEPDPPEDPELPELPEVPEEPLDPEVPLDPDVPELPDEPEFPELPEDPEEPLDRRFVPTLLANVDISQYPPLFVPPLSNILSLFWFTSIVTPFVRVVFVVAAFRNISPPSSPFV